jgi:predicted nucleotide-binding protein
MARKPAAPAPLEPKKIHNASQLRRCMERIDERIEDLRAFDVNTLQGSSSPELQALESAIKDTLERCFGVNTSAAQRFSSAAQLHYFSFVISTSGPRPDYRGKTATKIEESIALLLEAKRTLLEDLSDLEHESSGRVDLPVEVSEKSQERSRRVFVVHGHEQGPREAVARFLQLVGFEPVILHEQANKGGTVIEKIERYGDVGFAVVLLTPDDEGRAKGGELRPRARQNVLLELGYFMARLTRPHVFVLKQGDIELPSDFLGMVWTDFDAANGWKQALAMELQEVGYEIDWNKVLGRR